MKVLDHTEIGRPTTVGEMIECLKKVDPELPITYEHDSSIRLVRTAVQPDDEELLDFKDWVKIEDLY